jgi:asparagine synthase (glutamine-hydrolysing)
MSGIAGIFYLDGRPAEQETIDKMVGAMKHRGPDGIHTWREGSVALGHCMLHTTPEALYDNLPMESRDGNLVLTADARIDNRDELMRILDLRPDRDRPVTDCDLIMAAYQKWEEDCPKHLLGAFAFAIWDKRERRLFCARDHFGVKPFYWFKTKSVLAFASEIAVLVETVGGRSMEVDPVIVAHHLGVPVDGVADRTGYENIRKVEPGTSVMYVAANTTIDGYYNLQPEASVGSMSETEIIERFRGLFDDCVDARLRTSGRAGGMLSGGLDSSSIIASAIRHGRNSEDKGFPVYSALFGTNIKSDESIYIDAVLDRYPSLVSFNRDCDKIDAYKGISYIILRSKILTSSANIYINNVLYGQAGADSVEVVLSGFDGDTTISHGREYLHELRDTGRLFKLSNELYYVAKVAGLQYRTVLRNWLREPVASLPGIHQARAVYRKIKYGSSNVPSATKPMWEELISEALMQSVQEDIPDETNKPDADPKTQQERHREQVMRTAMVQTLELIDVVAARHRVEVRFPFFDKRLIEFCLAVPGNLKIRRGWTRYILRQAMRERLPHAVRKRANKGNLAFALDQNLRSNASENVRHLLPEYGPEIAKYVDVDKTRPMIQNYASNQVGSGNKYGNFVIRMALLELWLSIK